MPPKVTKKRARTPESDDSGRDDGGKSSAKKSKTKKVKSEEQYWDLSKNRRITVTDYSNKTFVNIREYYEADGEMKPGKKGISLTVDQYKELRKHISPIDEELLKRGEKLDDNDSEKDDKPVKKLAASKKDKNPAATPKKANIEATSDEEESD